MSHEHIRQSAGKRAAAASQAGHVHVECSARCGKNYMPVSPRFDGEQLNVPTLPFSQ